jgi:intracellular sulfur oxidation DsrE/DsrF family protein
MRLLLFVAFTAVSTPMLALSQDGPQSVSGPAIDEWGATFRVADPTFATDMEMAYRVVFDVPTAPESPDHLNRSFNSVARFLNMHLAAGVSPEQIHLALVVHGAATWGVTRPEVYESHTGTENPNLGLIDALLKNGVQVIVCGQSAHSRGIAQDDLAPGVKIALSAMTADVMLQSRGYSLIQY